MEFNLLYSSKAKTAGLEPALVPYFKILLYMIDIERKILKLLLVFLARSFGTTGLTKLDFMFIVLMVLIVKTYRRRSFHRYRHSWVC